MVRQVIYIFLIAFILNVVWEHFHALLYVHYKGAVITSTILLRAALFDAAAITLFAYPFITRAYLKNKLWIMVVIATLFAIGLELWALETGRWAYGENMPIIPFIQTGLTPTAQLGLLAYISVHMSKWIIIKEK